MRAARGDLENATARGCVPRSTRGPAPVPAMVGYWDRGLRNRFANPAHADWFNLDPASIPGKHLREIIGEALYQLDLPCITAALRGEAQRVERVLPDPAGGPARQALAEYLPDSADGEVRGLYLVITDITALKASEAALRESEERFRRVVEASPAGIAAFQADGGCVMVNAAVARIIGATPESLLAQNFRELDSWRHSGLLEAALAVLDTGIPQSGTFCLGSSFGRLVHLEALLTTLLMHGRTHLLVLVNDVSERKRVEEALRASEELKRKTLQALPAHIAVLDHHGRIIAVNQAWTEFAANNDAANSAAVAVGANYLEVCRRASAAHNEDAIRASEGIEAVRAGTRRVFTMEYPCDSPAQPRWFLMTVVPLGAGVPEGLVITHLNITERKLAEIALAESESLLRTITEASSDCIFVLDRDYRLLFLNPASLRLIARARGKAAELEDVLGKTALDLFGDTPTTRSLARSDAQVMTTGIATTIEEQIDTPSGPRVHLAARAPLRDISGQVVGLVGIARDITERKQGETARLDELARQRDTLVREVHHRIKNHLQGITGLLSNRIAEHPDTRADLEDVIRQINTIAHVYGLQSRMGGARIELCQLLRETAGIGATPVDCGTPPDGVEREVAQAEGVPLALVLNELLTNAAKHVSAPGRPVRVALRDDGKAARILIRCGPATLPPGFDFAANQGLGTGLDLVRHLLPPEGASLRFVEEGDEVVAELTLEASLFSQ